MRKRQRRARLRVTATAYEVRRRVALRWLAECERILAGAIIDHSLTPTRKWFTLELTGYPAQVKRT